MATWNLGRHGRHEGDMATCENLGRHGRHEGDMATWNLGRMRESRATWAT